MAHKNSGMIVGWINQIHKSIRNEMASDKIIVTWLKPAIKLHMHEYIHIIKAVNKLVGNKK